MRPLLLLPVLSIARPAQAVGEVDAYATELQCLADHNGLHESLQWRRLVHYRPSAGRGWKSDAHGPLFFLAPEGRRDPHAELNATIAAIFSEQKVVKDGD